MLKQFQWRIRRIPSNLISERLYIQCTVNALNQQFHWKEASVLFISIENKVWYLLVLCSHKKALGKLGRQKQELISRLVCPHLFKHRITPLELLKDLAVSRSGLTLLYLLFIVCHTSWAPQRCESKCSVSKNCKEGKWKKKFASSDFHWACCLFHTDKRKQMVQYSDWLLSQML